MDLAVIYRVSNCAARSFFCF